MSPEVSLPGVEDHERPVFDLLPGALLVLVLVVGVVLGAGHGVAAVLAVVAAAAAVDAAASLPGDGGPSRGRTFVQERGEGVLFGRDRATLAGAAGLAAVGVRQLGVALPPSAAAGAEALPSSRPPALFFPLPVDRRLALLGLQRRLEVDVSASAAGAADEQTAAPSAEVVPSIYVGVAHVSVVASVQGDEPRPRVLLNTQLHELLLRQGLQFSVHLSHGGVVEEHRDGHGSTGGVGRPARVLRVVPLGPALGSSLLALFLVVVMVLLASSHLRAVFVLVFVVLAVFRELGGQAHVVGRDDQRWHHAPVHVLLHLVDGATEDDLTCLGVEGGGPGQAVRGRRRVLGGLVALARHVPLEARRGRGIRGVPSVVVGAVVSVVFGLFALHGAVAPVVVLVQQGVVQVVGLGGSGNLHLEALATLRTGGILSLAMSQHVGRNVLGQVLP